jgi:hypothetical protein
VKGSISIGCDSCREFLGFDGQPQPIGSVNVRSFPSIPEAEAAAIEAGWKIQEDPDFDPYVKCPRCQK